MKTSQNQPNATVAELGRAWRGGRPDWWCRAVLGAVVLWCCGAVCSRGPALSAAVFSRSRATLFLSSRQRSLFLLSAHAHAHAHAPELMRSCIRTYGFLQVRTSVPRSTGLEVDVNGTWRPGRHMAPDAWARRMSICTRQSAVRCGAVRNSTNDTGHTHWEGGATARARNWSAKLQQCIDVSCQPCIPLVLAKRSKRLVRQRGLQRPDAQSIAPLAVPRPPPRHVGRVCAESANVHVGHGAHADVDAPSVKQHLAGFAGFGVSVSASPRFATRPMQRRPRGRG